MRKKSFLAFTVGATLAMSGCFDGLEKNDVASVASPPAAQNVPPTIVGSPSSNVLEGESYDFTPNATDPDGDSLEFTIFRKPSWATFDRATGRLSGTPDGEDVGNFTNISISVSDGQAAASLGNFNITVDQIALGTATISWNPPTENSDGSALTDLAGYRIYYGRDSNNLDRSIALSNPGLTRYVVENLSQARWYFSMTSVNSGGMESARSATTSKTIG
jgi:Putative Ig domain